MIGGQTIGRRLQGGNEGAFRVAQLGRQFDERIENRGRSNVERLMTLSTSAVAVCCCSDCRNSLSSRVFSMAMTAWAAKFSTSSICLSVNGRTS